MSSDAADAQYEAIRQCSTDIREIASRTNWKARNVAKVKRHLFEQFHWLDLYEELGVPGEWGRFDSNPEIASSWDRLRNGLQTESDLQLLRHEIAEAWFMRKRGPSYCAAHRAAQKRYPWPRI